MEKGNNTNPLQDSQVMPHQVLLSRLGVLAHSWLLQVLLFPHCWSSNFPLHSSLCWMKSWQWCKTKVKCLYSNQEKKKKIALGKGIEEDNNFPICLGLPKDQQQPCKLRLLLWLASELVIFCQIKLYTLGAVPWWLNIFAASQPC